MGARGPRLPKPRGAPRASYRARACRYIPFASRRWGGGGVGVRRAQRAGHLSRAISEKLTALLLSRREEITHPNPVLAVDFAFRMTFDMLDQATLFWDIQRSTIQYSPEQVAEELSRAFLSYLGVESLPAWDGSTDG